MKIYLTPINKPHNTKKKKKKKKKKKILYQFNIWYGAMAPHLLI